MIKDKSDIDLTLRSSFLCWTPVTLRFSDQDSLGHVNNVAIAAFVEAGRTGLIHPLLMHDKYPNLNFALVNVEIDYLAEFHYPGTIDIGGRLERIGSKSFTSKYGLFMGNRCVATAGSVNVFFDIEKRKSMAPPDDVRAMFEKTLEEQPS